MGGGQTFYRLSLLSALRGEFDLDLGAQSAGDFFECRQRHAIVIPPLQACDVGLLHADPPCEFRLGPAVPQPGSDQILRQKELRAGGVILCPYRWVLKKFFYVLPEIYSLAELPQVLAV